ncbi:MAG: Uma2 family endonuclease [Microcoleaceae cyanobacterium]
MIIQTENKTYTAEEYLELEIAAETRSEYRNGEIIQKTDETPNHNDISGNLYILLKSALKNQDYQVFILDQRLWIPQVSVYTYPDVMVIPKPLELQTGRKDTVVNPYFIAEVLSKSTQNYDRSEKFTAYRTLPNFKEYLLIDQEQVYVEHYVKTAVNQWLLTEYSDENVSLSFHSFECHIQIKELYENIEFV